MTARRSAFACRPACRGGLRRRRLGGLLLSGLALLPARLSAAATRDRHFTTTDGVALHYTDDGTPRAGQPALALVPGWSMPAWIWDAQVAHFSSARRVLALDPRGQGQSARPATGYDYRRRGADIIEWLQAAEAEPVVLVGWSLAVLECLQALSGSAGLRARVRGLVLVDNSVGEGAPPAAPQPGRPPLVARLRTKRRPTVEGFVRSMFRQPQPQAWLERLTEAALRLPLPASIALLSQNTPREFWRDTLYGLQMPVLYVVTPRLARQAELAQAHDKRIQSEVFEESGHALFVDDAARFNTLLADFMSRLPATGAASAVIR